MDGEGNAVTSEWVVDDSIASMVRVIDDSSIEISPSLSDSLGEYSGIVFRLTDTLSAEQSNYGESSLSTDYALAFTVEEAPAIDPPIVIEIPLDDPAVEEEDETDPEGEEDTIEESDPIEEDEPTEDDQSEKTDRSQAEGSNSSDEAQPESVSNEPSPASKQLLASVFSTFDS